MEWLRKEPEEGGTYFRKVAPISGNWDNLGRYNWLNFYFPVFFLCKYVIMNIKQKKIKNKTEDKIELQHIHKFSDFFW